jgi:hypothetical protein
LGDSSTGDALGQGTSSLGHKLAIGAVKEVKGSLGFNEGLLNHLEDLG